MAMPCVSRALTTAFTIMAALIVSACGYNAQPTNCPSRPLELGQTVKIGDVVFKVKSPNAHIRLANNCAETWYITFTNFNSDNSIVLANPGHSVEVWISILKPLGSVGMPGSRLKRFKLQDSRIANLNCSVLPDPQSDEYIGVCSFAVRYSKLTTLQGLIHYKSTDERAWLAGIQAIVNATDALQFVNSKKKI